MKISRPAIKNNARILMSKSKPSPFLVALVFFSISYVLNFLLMSVSGQAQMFSGMMEAFASGNYDYMPTMPELGLTAFLLMLAISIMYLMMDVGFRIYSFNLCSGKKASYGNLFDGFGIFFKVLWLHILMFFFIYLWSLLLIIPGIIASYRYRMALFIMLDNPDIGALECIRRSKQMMIGRKWELFVLDLSFLGWSLLTVLPFVSIYVIPYKGLSYVNYYIALRNMPNKLNRAV
ncbi:MAG: DUF975 family protein [Clostridiales bacterium]|nr:DUF975 family protein [Clostridiales bacterium]